jgi:glucuronokinase
MTAQFTVPARAGLLGNPSDGYFGKTISIAVTNFRATVSLTESSQLHIEPHEYDLDVYDSLDHLVESVSKQGYYGGARLVKAAIKKFSDYCTDSGIILQKRNFTVRYGSSIPRQVGLAGSSAIVTATIRALIDFHEVPVPEEILPDLILSAEVDELGITAGLQDRVIQVLGGCVFMDFSEDVMSDTGHGDYQHIDPSILPDFYLAYSRKPEKISGKVLNDLRTRFEAGDREVISILGEIARLAEEGREVVRKGDMDRLGRLMDRNFDLRSRIMKISEKSREMIMAARGCGASAKFTGSGGAIIGIVSDEKMFNRLSDRLQPVGVDIIRPTIA